METTFWGPSGWRFLHTLTFIYPDKPSTNDKLKMYDFMNLICFILPCKYCRESFNNYSKSLPINDHLESRESLVEWFYKMHNKVNKKLRNQGFCSYPNPEIESVTKMYEPIVKDIKQIYNKHGGQGGDSNDDGLENAIRYICNLGKDFLGSIIFNYQGYFSNCHTSNEKINIISVYNKFFNSIIPMISAYLPKLDKVGYYAVRNEKGKTKMNSNINISKFKIKSFLVHNEPYSKLINWFYNCKELCYLEKEYKSQEEYETHFRKHIVISCNNPKLKKIKSCRKLGAKRGGKMSTKRRKS